MANWSYGFLVIGSVTLLTVLLQAAILRRVPYEVLRSHHEVAAALIVVVGTMYGILLASVMIAVWGRYDEAREDVGREANSTATFYRTVQYLPSPIGASLRTSSLAYLDAVVRREWPMLHEGREDPETSAVLDDLWRTTTTWQPNTFAEQNLHAAALGALAKVGNLRQHRLARSRQGPNLAIWILLIVGGLVVIGFSYFFGLSHRTSKLVMTGAHALMISLVLFAIWGLQRPYAGVGALTPDEFELAVRILTASWPP